MCRAAQEALTKVAVQCYHPIQAKEATILASTLLVNPENRDQHFQQATASTMLSILYDFPTLTSVQDKAIQEIDSTVNSSARAAVGTSLIEFFPWTVYIPQRFAKWKREALKQSAERAKMSLRLFSHVKTDLV
ncbi:hypothetical protein DFH94DRAFT_609101, partial [Russula ochroleuca]